MIDWATRKYTKEGFIQAWESSTSLRQVGLKLGLYMTGDAYRVIDEVAKELKLTKDHFTNTNNHKRNRIPFESILIKNSNYPHTNHLKRRLLNAGLLENVCHECRMKPVWNKKSLVLSLDHINGVGNDNRLENLRLLCPNCDSQQPTYRGRNKGH